MSDKRYVSFTGGGPLNGKFLSIVFPHPPEIHSPMESLLEIWNNSADLPPATETVKIGVYKLREYRAYGTYGPVNRAYYFQGVQ